MVESHDHIERSELPSWCRRVIQYSKISEGGLTNVGGPSADAQRRSTEINWSELLVANRLVNG